MSKELIAWDSPEEDDEHPWAGYAPTQKWGPKHDQVVFLHCLGYDNILIAAELGIGKMYVSKLLRDPIAQRKILEFRRKTQQKLIDGVEGRLLRLADESVKRLEETMEEAFEPGTRAKEHQDKTALALLRGTGFLKSEVVKEKEVNTLTKDQAELLHSAISKSMSFREVEVQDAVFSVESVEKQKEEDNGPPG